MDTSTSEVLDRAADHIRQYGHHKGSGFASGDRPWTSPACTIGAIVVATRDEDDYEAARAAAQAAVRSYLGDHIVMWNDAPARTAAEVVEALRAAAMVERTREAAAVEAVSA